MKKVNPPKILLYIRTSGYALYRPLGALIVGKGKSPYGPPY